MTSKPASSPAFRVASTCGASKYAGTVMTARMIGVSSVVVPALSGFWASVSFMRSRSSMRIFELTSSGVSS